MQAYSKDLFGKQPASLKDVELNVEACSCEEEIFLDTVYRYSVGDWLWEAVFAVMSVTPHAKLSEEVLAAAVKLHYEQQGLPVGVAIQALEAFAARVALGLKKVVTKFRDVYRQSPHGAKSKAIQGLKQRLQQEGESAPDAKAEDKHAKEEDLEQLAAPPDWAQVLAEKVKKMKEQKAAALASAPVEPAKADGPEERPIPTPARSNVLPKFVLETLQKEKTAEPVAPFSVWEKGAKEDVCADALKDDGQKKKQTTRKNAKKSQKKNKKAVVADDEVENGLGGEVPVAGSSKEKEVVAEGACVVKYEPQIFLQKKRDFIETQRAAKSIGYREAEQLWMQSGERASYLQTLSLKELKRRRFM